MQSRLIDVPKGSLEAHLVEFIPCIKAQSLLQLSGPLGFMTSPIFDSAFTVSLHPLQSNEAERREKEKQCSEGLRFG